MALDRTNPTVTVGSSALPSGAATAAKQDTLQTAIDAIKTAVEILDNTVAGTEQQVDVITLPNVTLAAGTNTNEVVGDVAHDVAPAGNPVLVGFEGRSTDQTVVTTGRVTRVLATLLGKIVNYLYALPGATWTYAAVAGGLVTTTDVAAKTAAGAGIRNYVSRAQIHNSHQTISTEVVIKDGATVIWRGWAQAAGGGVTTVFDPPLRGTADTAINIAEITTTATAGVLVNLQGFTAAE